MNCSTLILCFLYSDLYIFYHNDIDYTPFLFAVLFVHCIVYSACNINMRARNYVLFFHLVVKVIYAIKSTFETIFEVIRFDPAEIAAEKRCVARVKYEINEIKTGLQLNERLKLCNLYIFFIYSPPLLRNVYWNNKKRWENKRKKRGLVFICTHQNAKRCTEWKKHNKTYSSGCKVQSAAYIH